MIEDTLALGRRAVACKGFRWMPGMLDSSLNRILSVSFVPPVYARVSCGGGPVQHDYALATAIPVFSDLATLGCLLALVREAWAAPRALVRLSANGKSFHVFDVDRVTRGGNWAAFLCGDHGTHTEAHALVAALEAAP